MNKMAYVLLSPKNLELKEVTNAFRTNSSFFFMKWEEYLSSGDILSKVLRFFRATGSRGLRVSDVVGNTMRPHYMLTIKLIV